MIGGQKPLIVVMVLLAALAGTLGAAPQADLWPRWQEYDPGSDRVVDHSAWERFLGKYLVTSHPSGITRVEYGEVSAADRQMLESYLDGLQQVPVSQLNRNEQKAYWINLYNAATLDIVLDHYPVSSITKINLSSGLFSRGPWEAKILKIEGEEVSLNDVEHRILRPIWKDPRVHYAVNCASIGCPNLQDLAYTSENTEVLLEKGAWEYINHPRGVTFEGKKLVLSGIYDWFQEDFDGSEQAVLRHLRRYAAPGLAGKLESYAGRINYEYDWSLNEA
jgi:hypothetical protein